MDETDLAGSFYNNFRDNPQSHHRTVRVSGSSNKNNFVIKFLRFCDIKTQQRFHLNNLQEKSIPGKQIVFLLDNLRDVLEAFKQASKSSQIPLSRLETEVGSTVPKDGFFAQYFKNIGIVPTIKKTYNFVLNKKTKCVFLIKIIDTYGDQLFLAEIVYFNHHEYSSLSKNRYFLGYKCGLCESNDNI